MHCYRERNKARFRCGAVATMLMMTILLTGCGVTETIRVEYGYFQEQLFKTDNRSFGLEWAEAVALYPMLNWVPQMTGTIDCIEETDKGVVLSYKRVSDYREMCRKMASVVPMQTFEINVQDRDHPKYYRQGYRAGLGSWTVPGMSRHEDVFLHVGISGEPALYEASYNVNVSIMAGSYGQYWALMEGTKK